MKIIKAHAYTVLLKQVPRKRANVLHRRCTVLKCTP